MSREAKRADLLEHFKIKTADGENTFVEVEMKINGVEVDFSKSVTEIWERMQSSYDEDLLEKAKELVGVMRLERLQDIIQGVEDKLEREVNELFSKTFGVV